METSKEIEDLIQSVLPLLLQWVEHANNSTASKETGVYPKLTTTTTTTTADLSSTSFLAENGLVNWVESRDIDQAFPVDFPDRGQAKDGIVSFLSSVLRYSVNTWDQGFLDKLYSSNTAPGVVSDLILAFLNTNVHVYKVSPALTLIEKKTAEKLANMFGLTGPRAGGVTCPGGSASNHTALLTARHILYPQTKVEGNGSLRFALFTSADSHYSIKKAAIMCGLGSDGVFVVAVDEAGRMDPEDLQRKIHAAENEHGMVPLFVNATAGTTVWGAYDPLPEIARVCEEYAETNRHGRTLWLHVDASWGGAVVFSEELRRGRLDGSGRVHSITFNPHKMANVPVTCSFLLVANVDFLSQAHTIAADYLFHEDHDASGSSAKEYWDLADLTPQCGRRADSFKLAFVWMYYGTQELTRRVEKAFETASGFAEEVRQHPQLALASPLPIPCLQVCFFYTGPPQEARENASLDAEIPDVTKTIVNKLIVRGFMVDYTQDKRGGMFRVVVNSFTLPGTLTGLIKAIVEEGEKLIAQ